MFELTENETLLTECKSAVQREKQSTARVLEYLSEIDKRRLWLQEGYSSLFDFCIRFLNYSEGETYRRIQAYRSSVRIKEIKALLESGSLTLTTMSLLSPVLTQENANEILPKVVNQSTREVEKVLEQHFPENKPKTNEIFKVELDPELKELIERAKLLASEKDSASLLRKVLKNFVRERQTRSSNTKRHTRYVQKPMAREVKARDAFRCTYLSPKGLRCNQQAHIQIDHIRSFAKGGSSKDIKNLRCLCRAHNLFLAKRDFPHFVIRSKSIYQSSPPYL